MKYKFLTKTILIVSIISLLNDISSEILYPVMPLFLSSLGFSPVFIGIMEGFAEATASLSKGYFGKLSDITSKRVPFVRLGYFLSAISKPMIAFLSYSFFIFIGRFFDRLGKGIRTGARDAILSNESSIENRGKVFGFHKAMDTLGATIGPIFALIYLHFYPENYKTLFFIAFIPALLGVFLTFFIKDKNIEKVEYSKKEIINPFSYFLYWKKASEDYKKVVIGLLFFTLFNSSNTFLLLMARNQGFNDRNIIGVYIFYNLIYAIFSYPFGSLADNIGMKKTFIIGLILFSIVYYGMAFVNTFTTLYILFFIYGLYAASTEGISKAWISNITPKNHVATAIGLYTSLNSLLTLIASTLTGLIWVYFNPSLPFIISATGTLITIFYFLSRVK